MAPDVTLVTACYDLTKYSNGARPLEESIRTMAPLLELECFLCIFCDSTTINLIKYIRNEHYRLAYLTHYIELPLENLWTYQYAEKIRENRAEYYPTRDDRVSMEAHLVQCNKFDFVLEAMKLDPFSTRKFGWIDANIGINARKICENYHRDILPNVLHNVTDKFHIQILNVQDKSYLSYDNLRDYYREYRWLVCGCLFTMGKKVGIPILNRLKEIFHTTTLLGCGHGDEPLFLRVLEEFYDSIERSYGDYYNILNNFTRQTRGFQYVHDFILQRYMHYGYFREGYDCTKRLIADFDVGDASNELQFQIHYKHLLFAVQYKKEEVPNIIGAINDGIQSGKYREEFMKGDHPHLELFRSLRACAKLTTRRIGSDPS